MIVMRFLKKHFKDELFIFEIGNRYFNWADLLRSCTDTNRYLLNLKILYKFYKGLWREVKITQKCDLQQSKE